MNFTINKVILWFRYSNEIREIEFKPNKINIITGNNNTGKSAILEIIDYCLLSDKIDIDLEVINENVEWYGLNFTINSKTYTIARGRLTDLGNISDTLYFNPNGEIPELPEKNSNYDEIQIILNKKFNLIFKDLPLTGKQATATKVSYRHFLLFNLLSDNILTDKNNYFSFGRYSDKHIKKKFDIVFDLAIGAEDPNIIKIKNKLTTIKNKLDKLYDKRYKYTTTLYQITNDAKKLGIVDQNIEGVDENQTELNNIMHQFERKQLSADLSKLSELQTTEIITSRDIARLKRHKQEYEKYKSLQNDDLDSLKPIEYIYENYKEIIKTPDILEFIENLENEFITVKKEIKNMPIPEMDIEAEIDRLEYELKQVQLEIEQFPLSNLDFDNEVGKFIYIGQLKERFNELNKQKKKDDFERFIKEYEKQIEDLLPFIENKDVDKQTVIKQISDLIQKQIDNSNALEEYRAYKAKFDNDNKTLIYSKSNTKPEFNKNYSGLGGSSNYLFLQLAFSLGLHEYFLNLDKNTPQIANFMIIDKFSLAFSKETSLDLFQKETKLKDALNLLATFIEYLNKRLNNTFQFILLDTAQQKTYRNLGVKNVNFVVDFPDKNNALIPKKQIELMNDFKEKNN